jgi:chromosome segregation ATPase
MPKHPEGDQPNAGSDPELDRLRDQLADAQAESERLQGQAADAEARAQAAEERLTDAQTELEAMRLRLGQLEEESRQRSSDLAQRDEQLAQASQETDSLRQRLRETAVLYRDARLATHPDVPADLVTADAVEEIDQQFEAALKLVSQVRDRIQSQSQAGRVPIGAPPRRAPDLSSLSPSEKIRLGLSNS